MKSNLKTLAPVLLFALGAPWLTAQITNDIKAHVDHTFMVGNTTLPPGDYTFHMMQDSGLSLMTATNDASKASVEFLVQQSVRNHAPAHSELVFRKYGDIEVLHKVFEKGQATGTEVIESNRQEARLAKTGEPTEHSEEQK